MIRGGSKVDSGKANKPKQAEKLPATKKAATKKPTEKKKKNNEMWAWKNKAPKDSDAKENDAFVKTFETKKYFWCKNHNNGTGMWTLHHPNDCEKGSGSMSLSCTSLVGVLTYVAACVLVFSRDTCP